MRTMLLQRQRSQVCQFACCVTLAALLFVNAAQTSDETPAPLLWWPPNVGVIEQAYVTCDDSVEDNMVACLKNKAANAFEQILAQNLTLADGFVLAKNDHADAAPDTDKSTNNAVNSDPDVRISNAIKRLLETHTFILDLSKLRDLKTEAERAEARGKDKKKKKALKKILPHLVLGCIAIMAIMGPLAVKWLYLIAGHAFLASKIALVISGMVALKKLFASDHHHDTTLHIHAEDEKRRWAELHGWEEDQELKMGFTPYAATGAVAAASSPYGAYSTPLYSSSYVSQPGTYNRKVMYRK